MLLCLDTPQAGQRCDALCFRVEGWLQPDGSGDQAILVEAWVGGHCVGSTRHLFVRPDVNLQQGWSEGTRSGFSLVAHAAAGPFGGEAPVQVLVKGEGRILASTERMLSWSGFDHRTSDYGILLRQDFPPLHHREHIYTSGPSQAEGSGEVLALIARSLGPEPVSILDVGCGLGWYGSKLRALGHRWHGAEMKAEDCAAMAAAGLPHTQVQGDALPFPDGAYAAAMAIEVLEHIADVPAFLREVRRVAPDRLFLSVPNAELLAYLRRYLAVPWHMLEADHKNFFTRWSLAEALRPFYPNIEVGLHTEHPLRSPEGTPLYYNLFAHAWR
ncbi:MAG TPA: class I SAM-dependent methyltransferase [Opitutaceae bacterium]|jgi:SAM-dependent methyltransferase|nr:class I SAM-dependent methyltransferase [Opitutaceae bacterium]